ncbi:P-loop containing nucleoside triphosphate hydrolase protein [Mycena alexandri]|uniref:P-loop containing nucleoside triphosphate hydrolase protein n=1 Tax=Mycena alexandri TaxID=1745969 RepID=A0AAD6S7N8_9AGAR|nr:P-loop containing nucleoside triphosphate hydrolase protein [Mycena alexandri]
MGKKAPSKSKSEWLAPAILTARTITAASECAPFPYIKGVSGTVVILLETIQKVKKNREDLKELCNTTTEIVTILHDQILAHGNTAAVKFKVLCEELESHLEVVILVVQNLQDQSKGFRGRVKEFVKSSSTADEIAGYQQKIQALCSKLKLMAVVETNFKVDEIHTIITAPSFAMVTAVQTINNCPPPSRIFQGRQTILDKMHQFFNAASGRQLIYVLHGLGGAGKTQIALKYIQESTANFSDIFLVDASTLDTIDTGLKNMAMSKSVGDSAQDALTWLQSKHGQWLLFFDNADDPGINLNKFFPLCDHGNIIITSRNPELKVYGEHYPVSDMEEADAIALLLRSATKGSSEEDVQIAAKIVKELYFLPLGIAQAGAFISKSEDLNSYLTLYQKNQAKLLREKPGQSHDQYAWTVYTTWQISFDKLSPLAATLLQLCSFLHYSGISEDMFSNASKYRFPVWLPPKEELQAPLQFLSHFLGPTGEWNSLRFSEVTNEIKSYSLITFDAATKMFSIHPLVHAWSRNTLVDEAASHLCVSSLLGMSIAEIPNHDITLASLRLMPHISSVTPFNTVDVEADFRAAFWGIYFSTGKLTKAQNLIEHTCEKYRLVFGEEHLATLVAMHRLGLTYSHLGEYKKAKELEVTVLEKRTKLLGEDHPDTLSAMGDLAWTHSALGDFAKAKELRVVVLEKRTKLLGEDHPDTLLAMGNLATTWFELGDFAKAKELQATVLKKQITLLGRDHPQTLLAMGDLARSHSELGDFEKAKELGLMVLEKRTKLLGEDHPDTLLTSAI